MTASVSSAARGQLGRAHRELRPLDRGGVDRPGEDLVAAAELDQLDAVLLEVVVLAELLQRDPDVGEGGVRVERGELLGGERAGGAEERGLKQLGERRHGRSPSARTAPVERDGRCRAWRAPAARAGSTARPRWSAAGRAPRASRSPSRSSSSASIRRVALSTSSGRATTRCSTGDGNARDHALHRLEQLQQVERERRRRQLGRRRQVAARELLRPPLGRRGPATPRSPGSAGTRAAGAPARRGDPPTRRPRERRGSSICALSRTSRLAMSR